MKLSETTKKKLTKLKSVGSEIILSPPHDFAIFGDGINNGIVVEGTIDEEVGSYSVIKNFRKFKSKYNPEKKLGYFNELLSDTNDVASFTLTKRVLERTMKDAHSLKSTHIRFYRKEKQSAKVRVFDARKYFDELIEDTKSSKRQKDGDLLNADGEPFYFYVKVKTLRCLLKEDYEVTVFDNGLIEFVGIDSSLIYTVRDQRLGQAFDEIINDQLGPNNVLLFDSRTAPSVRRKMKQQS